MSINAVQFQAGLSMHAGPALDMGWIASWPWQVAAASRASGIDD
ncbi:hypothetical protein ACWGY7_20525 [Xanthomonas axonopodis pv. khayae]